MWSGSSSCGHGRSSYALIVGRDLSSSSLSPTYGVIIRFYDLSDAACPQ